MGGKGEKGSQVLATEADETNNQKGHVGGTGLWGRNVKSLILDGFLLKPLLQSSGEYVSGQF